MPLYMGSHKGTTGPTADRAQSAATAFFERYPDKNRCIVHLVREGPRPDLVTIVHNAGASGWKRLKKGDNTAVEVPPVE